MRINNPNSNYVINRKTNLVEILSTFERNKGFPITVSNDDGTIFGIVSKGDLINKLASLKDIDTNSYLTENLVNKYPLVGHLNDSLETIQGYLEPVNINALPIIDQRRKIIKIITKESPAITLQKNQITDQSFPYLIAEIGVNHNGDIAIAKELIIEASKAKCNAVKFQHRSENTYSRDDLNSFDLGTQYIISEVNRTNLKINELESCCDLAEELGLAIIVTPFDEMALNEILNSKIKLSALKIASCDLTNLSLIKNCSGTNLPLIISTGMSYEREILKTSRYLLDSMVEHAFLHCNSTYPTPIEDINLNYINRLKEITNVIVGYSSHDGNINIPLNSIAHGAKIIEFHITKSKDAQGTDHRASIETKFLKGFIDQAKILFYSSGKRVPRKPSQGELANRLSLGKSFALNKNMKKGDKINNDDLILLSPGCGLSYSQKNKLVGKVLRKDCLSHQILKIDDVENLIILSKDNVQKTLNNLVNYGYKAGIPVRYHDFHFFNNLFNPRMLEFHMSDRDLNLSPKVYLNNKFIDVDLIVHGVEQFEDGFIFDLSSSDEYTLNRSFTEIERLIKHIDNLRNHFKDVNKIPIVLNVGGFTKDNFVREEMYKYMFEKLTINLQKINRIYSGYDFMPQTMPPFPWHQGGRSFHNLITKLSRLKDFLNCTDNKVCLDISHTALSCFHFKENIIEHIQACKNRIGHIHLSDAQGANSEGLEVGNGILDFKEIHKAIKQSNEIFYIIPEIWQGHLNGGEAFYRSFKSFLEFIE